jgi:hypothetical protein
VRGAIGVVVGAALCAAPAAAAGDTFYQGGGEEAPLFTNIPGDGSARPLKGFDGGGTVAAPRPAAVRARAFDDLIESTARQYGVHPQLVRAIIQVESAFDPGAVSPKGARGLMQLMPETARRYGVHNLFDPVENIRAGVRHLAYLGRRYGEDIDRALAAYNAGEEAVRRYGGVPDFDETRDYVRKVRRLHPGPILLRDSREAEPPAFFSYEDEEGVLHVSDVPIEARRDALPCARC